MPRNRALFSDLTVVFDLPQQRVNARTRLNECLRPCRVDHAKNGSSKNRQIRCDGMNFDTPTSPLRVSGDVIATIMFGSLGHWTTDSFPYISNAPTDGQLWEGGNKHRCRLLALSGHAQCADECPLLRAKRTLTNRCLPSGGHGPDLELRLGHYLGLAN